MHICCCRLRRFEADRLSPCGEGFLCKPVVVGYEGLKLLGLPLEGKVSTKLTDEV